VTVTASPSAVAMTMETALDPRPADLLHLFKGVDLIIIEGYKHEPVPKIFLSGSESNSVNTSAFDDHVIAVVSDMPVETGLPVFSRADATEVAGFLLRKLCTGSHPSLF
jgi:molybdopterin-guanine dinucleotide biosynthesis adapter protein